MGCMEVFLRRWDKKPYSEECLQRIVELMAKHEDSKVRARYQRHSEKTTQAEPEESAEQDFPPQGSGNAQKDQKINNKM